MQIYVSMYNQKQSQSYDSLLSENESLKQENRQATNHILKLEQENRHLKIKIADYQHRLQMSNIKEEKLRAVNPVNQKKMQYPDLDLNSLKDNSTPLEPAKNNGNYNIPIQNFNYPDCQVQQVIKDQQIQQKSKYICRQSHSLQPAEKSWFMKFFDNTQTSIKINYQFLQVQKAMQFFNYDWYFLEELSLDGNYYNDEGLQKISQKFWPNLTKLSLAYNNIISVKQLENLPKLKSLDLRANPLSKQSIAYLEKFAFENPKCKVLY